MLPFTFESLPLALLAKDSFWKNKGSKDVLLNMPFFLFGELLKLRVDAFFSRVSTFCMDYGCYIISAGIPLMNTL